MRKKAWAICSACDWTSEPGSDLQVEGSGHLHRAEAHPGLQRSVIAIFSWGRSGRRRLVDRLQSGLSAFEGLEW